MDDLMIVYFNVELLYIVTTKLFINYWFFILFGKLYQGGRCEIRGEGVVVGKGNGGRDW